MSDVDRLDRTRAPGRGPPRASRCSTCPTGPRRPVPGTAVRDREVALSWRAPAANGAPDRPLRGARHRRRHPRVRRHHLRGRRASTNGRDYRFEVRAHNAVGWSQWSPPSRRRHARRTPGPGRRRSRWSRRATASSRSRWTPPTTETSDIKQYVVSWQDGGSARPRSGPRSPRPASTTTGRTRSPSTRSTRPSAARRASPGAFQSLGTPARPGRADDHRAAARSSDDTAVQVTWPAVDPPNGPGPVRYTVLRDGTPLRQLHRHHRHPVHQRRHPVRRHHLLLRRARRPTRTAQGKTVDRAGRDVPGGRRAGAVGPLDASTPTGANNQAARSTYTVPDTNGAQSHVRDLSSTAPCVARARRHRRAQPSRSPTPDNDGPHAFRSRPATRWAPACARTRKTVQTYGPLAARQITNMTPRQQRQERAAGRSPSTPTATRRRVTVDSDQRRNETFQHHRSPAPFTFSTPADDIGYDKTETAHA